MHSSSSNSKTTGEEPLNRELLAQWSSIDWNAIGNDDDDAAPAPVLPLSVSAVAAHGSLVAQLKEERQRQQQQEAAAAADKKRSWNDYVQPDAPLEWSPHQRVGRVEGADRMTVFDEWFWLVFIGNNGVATYRRAINGKATLRDHLGLVSAALFLSTHKAAVVQLQKDRLKSKIDHGGEHMRCCKQFEVMAAAFMQQPRTVFTVRAFSRNWCISNVHVLQWLADYVGAPVALIHRGRGWCAEYLPRCTKESVADKYPPAADDSETEAQAMAHHTWRPAENCIVLYISDDTDAVGGLVFGVELAPQRAQLWAKDIVRLRSPYCAMTNVTKYSVESLLSLDARLLACRAALRCDSKQMQEQQRQMQRLQRNEIIIKKEESAADGPPPRRSVLFKKIASVLTAY